MDAREFTNGMHLIPLDQNKEPTCGRGFLLSKLYTRTHARARAVYRAAQRGDYRGCSSSGVMNKNLGELAVSLFGADKALQMESRFKTTTLRLARWDLNLTLRTFEGDRMLGTLVAKELTNDVYRLARLSSNDAGCNSHYLRGSIILDIGGHVGATAILLAILCPNVTIHTFEPVPVNFYALVWNIRMNGLCGRVVPHNVALTESSTPVKVVFSSDDTTSSRLFHFGEVYGKGERLEFEVPSMTFDEVLGEVVLGRRVAFVKLDCEGCEYSIVKGHEEFWRTVARIAGELHLEQLKNRGATEEVKTSAIEVDSWLRNLSNFDYIER